MRDLKTLSFVRIKWTTCFIFRSNFIEVIIHLWFVLLPVFAPLSSKSCVKCKIFYFGSSCIFIFSFIHNSKKFHTYFFIHIYILHFTFEILHFISKIFIHISSLHWKFFHSYSRISTYSFIVRLFRSFIQS
jgi:hypothetical protein